jgi:hypothetical protein
MANLKSKSVQAELLAMIGELIDEIEPAGHVTREDIPREHCAKSLRLARSYFKDYCNGVNDDADDR